MIFYMTKIAPFTEFHIFNDISQSTFYNQIRPILREVRSANNE